MVKEINKKTLQKQQIVESYLKTTSKATFNQFVTKKETSIAVIDVGATSALHLMKHWISLYINVTSTRHTIAKLQKVPTRASAKFQAIYKKLKALINASTQYEVNSITTLGKYAKSASTSLEKYRELSRENQEDDEEQEEGTDEHEEDTDEQKNEQESEQTMDYLFKQLRVVAKKRILEDIIPLSGSLYIPKSC
jgi:hypothetical protein